MTLPIDTSVLELISNAYRVRVTTSKGQTSPDTGHEDPEAEQRYSSTLSLTSALDGGGWVVNATPRPLYPWDRDPVPIL